MFLLLSFSLSVSYNSFEYPEWFLRMPVGRSELFVVGYAPLYYNFSSSIEEAAEVARYKIIIARRDSIVGKRTYSLSPYGKFYHSDSIFEIVDTNAIKDVKLSIIDTAIVKNMVLILATTGKELGISSPIISDTAWVRKTPKIPGWVLETGFAPFYEYEQSSWLNAEKDARVSLGMLINYHLEDLKKYRETSIDGASIESVNCVISGVHTLARYINRKEGYCKVIIGIRKK
ncbi:hypothetical protein KAW48_06500 [candidate division WOR-3 bacterium]|nr:hypothetical protein [candidate division WOR-3 bacterium]